MEQKDRLETVIYELDSTINDFLEKGLFSITQLMELTSGEPEDEKEVYLFAHEQSRMNMFANMAFDYIYRAQNELNEIICREYRERKEALSDE